ncbi:hypothetical protein FACS189450_11920 [Spirochaetia bacterium]|nr:hypothetical protein FACS189450_11920 [Spirochaetia bacterium]
MPLLTWNGKEKVLNHHLDVPYHTLKAEYTYPKNAVPDGSLIIHGDNLLALKALLPQYEGRVKLIYIDPPYNTGNENWVYNDNVNDPKIKKWIGEVVGKEGEDFSRHDKWLCMMYPRLKLLHKLLREDGVIFISIDDNEQANLKLICDEIFGSNCLVSNVSWQRTYSTRNDSKGIVTEVEHILLYSKQPNWQPHTLPRTELMDAKYKNPDNDEHPWTSSSVTAPSAATHQGMVYAIQHPFTGELMYPTTGRCWCLQQSDMLKEMQKWCDYELKDLEDSQRRAEVCGVPKTSVRQGVCGIVLSDSLSISSAKANAVLSNGAWPYFYFTNGGKGGIRRKTYLKDVGGRLITNYWSYAEVGHTDEAKKELLSIFHGLTQFDTPKPTRLIERILQIAIEPDSIILDSFAGSGTTAHAVLNLNKQDGGNRKFILVEMEDYAETITAERIRRVIDGYGEGEKKVAGTGGSFSYCKLGEAVFNSDGSLNSEVSEADLRQYVWYAETKSPLQKIKKSADNPYYLGTFLNVAYYFYFDKKKPTTLGYAFLRTVKTKAEQYCLYADSCSLSSEYLESRNIRFRKIPRDIPRY